MDYLGLAYMVHHRDNGEWRQVLAASMVIYLQKEMQNGMELNI